MNTNKPKLLVCKYCNATVQKGSLCKHVRTHAEGQFLCDICGVYKGKWQCQLDRHKRSVHNVGEKSLNDCPFCHKKLLSFGKLEIHLRSHTMERPYFCKFCLNEFSGKQQFKNHHRRFHSSKKRQPRFHCHICSKQFFDKKYLKSHLKIHLGSVKDLPFKCDVCSKTFRSRQHITTHKRVHSKEKPYPCEICNVAFSQAEHLKVHMRVHTGEKPYACTICKKGFAQSTPLKIHMRMHSGGKPYACTVCKRRFSQRNNLKVHMMMTHSGEKKTHIRERNAK